MSVTSMTWRSSMARFAKNAVVRYLFALAMVAIALATRILIVPLTGKGSSSIQLQVRG